ncbi:MAG: hypothetical protein HAW66_01615 [Shewanella sp.]|nr:hypothetical protein [Shewanella sp.]
MWAEMTAVKVCAPNTSTQAKPNDEPDKGDTQLLLEVYSQHSQTSEDECEYFGMDGDSTADDEELCVPIAASAAVEGNSRDNLTKTIGLKDFIREVETSQSFLNSFKR